MVEIRVTDEERAGTWYVNYLILKLLIFVIDVIASPILDCYLVLKPHIDPLDKRWSATS